MKLTILETGFVPASLADTFSTYPQMIEAALKRGGATPEITVVGVAQGEALPDPQTLEAVVITGSSAGVYEDHAWLPGLRDFLRRAYAAQTRMIGICFGHQIIADALGGEVRKSEKGWGLGRHTYDVLAAPPVFDPGVKTLSIACSHQDQVITPPDGARVVLRSEFAPNAGLLYDNDAILTLQPHPEFEDDYARALIDLREGRAPEATLEKARDSMATPSDSAILARAVVDFLSR
ncbi:MAG TPA: type 1 glutamine amidotransferase [Pelagibacterium sp.]|uniref:glutamine amidotransferase-related protein n=1 Tax=Pelagibacterium sp. TaxID=1967288 RepID=UPI002B6B0707|nr:type 1 glutamine amidotransferase [Pelagibacterium sp.]HWJ87120.1 type 1 glutamine amidotransferase [Pelagibacterium sp.]